MGIRDFYLMNSSALLEFDFPKLYIKSIYNILVMLLRPINRVNPKSLWYTSLSLWVKQYQRSTFDNFWSQLNQLQYRVTHWFGMFHHLAQLLSQICQFPISPGRTRLRVEDPKSKSTQPRFARKCVTLKNNIWITQRFCTFTRLSESKKRTFASN